MPLWGFHGWVRINTLFNIWIVHIRSTSDMFANILEQVGPIWIQLYINLDLIWSQSMINLNYVRARWRRVILQSHKAQREGGRNIPGDRRPDLHLHISLRCKCMLLINSVESLLHEPSAKIHLFWQPWRATDNYSTLAILLHHTAHLSPIPPLMAIYHNKIPTSGHQ